MTQKQAIWWLGFAWFAYIIFRPAPTPAAWPE